jgi:hypothetical protein
MKRLVRTMFGYPSKTVRSGAVSGTFQAPSRSAVRKPRDRPARAGHSWNGGAGCMVRTVNRGGSELLIYSPQAAS